jgi:hypothetical protein
MSWAAFSAEVSSPETSFQLCSKPSMGSVPGLPSSVDRPFSPLLARFDRSKADVINREPRAGPTMRLNALRQLRAWQAPRPDMLVTPKIP